MRRTAVIGMAAALLAGSMGCNVLHTNDGEGVSGRGSKAFDPYQANASGAIRLSLQMYNGCALLPNSTFAGTGTLNLPNYPECRYVANQLAGHMIPDPNAPKPTTPIELMTGTNYFLNDFMVVESAYDLHKDPTHLEKVSNWFQSLPPFNKLDWDGLGIDEDVWQTNSNPPNPNAFTRTVKWGEAAWEKVTDDTFKVEVVDASGTVRATQTYARQDFLAQNPVAEHTEMKWEMLNAAPPAFPGDVSARQAPPPPPGFPPPGTLTFHSLFKLGLSVSTHPNKQFTIPSGLSGDGTIRVTWSQLPDDPFVFPVRFTAPEQIPATCYDATNGTDPVPCTFGVDPELALSKPKNGNFYEPGETVQVHLTVKDSNGNYLVAKDHFPSWHDYITGKSNGLIYFNIVNLADASDPDYITGFMVAGPKQDMRPVYALNSKQYYQMQTDQDIAGKGNGGLLDFPDAISAFGAVPGADRASFPADWDFTLPKDAKPGTYTVYWKVHRYFMGERSTKLKAFDFQVGQAEKTRFPGRIGNCQICHRGAISLDNVRHGLSVDYVEGCKACHVRDAFAGGRDISMQRLIHRIHMSSSKFPLPKNQCTVCHLTRESALRPSYVVCSSCHPAPHGGKFQSLEWTSDFDPKQVNTEFSDCGSACHANTPPTKHILPAQ